MTMQAVRELIDRHTPSAVVLSALTAALDARASGVPLDPLLATRIGELFGVLDATSTLDGVSAPEAAAVLAELRNMLVLDRKLQHSHTRSTAWDPLDPEVVQIGGEFGHVHGQMLGRMVIPALGLADRFQRPGAAFLNVGVGSGRLAIALAQMWPNLRILGLDPCAPAIRVARDNIERAGLSDHIEIREQGAETLDAHDAFDLAWIPTPFIPQRVFAGVCERTRQALRPGGYAIAAIGNHAAMQPAQGAAFRLRLALCGGVAWLPAELEAQLRDAGFAEIRALPTPPGAPVAIYAARK
jgi:precorrin-6B methylase 2